MSVRVLVVDDQEPFRLAAAEVVAALEGFELVGSVVSGESALQAADDMRPDVILMDVRLPGLDGREATRRIRVRHPSVRVLLVSADFDHSEVTDGCGALGCLPKQELSPERLQTWWEKCRDPVVSRIAPDPDARLQDSEPEE